MICQCQSAPGAGGAGMLPSAAKLSSQGRAKCKTRLPDRKVIKLTLCDCPFVMDSWPFFPAPGHAFCEEEVGAGELQVRHHCSRPHATSTAPPHQQSTHTCSGYGSRRSPEPCSCRSDPWPCIRAWLAPGPSACPLATHAANMAVRSMFICPRRDSSTDPDFTGSAECLCVVGTKTGNEEHKQERKCPWQDIYVNFQVGPRPSEELFYFATGGLTLSKWPSAKSTLHFLCISVSSSRLALCL